LADPSQLQIQIEPESEIEFVLRDAEELKLILFDNHFQNQPKSQFAAAALGRGLDISMYVYTCSDKA